MCPNKVVSLPTLVFHLLLVTMRPMHHCEYVSFVLTWHQPCHHMRYHKLRAASASSTPPQELGAAATHRCWHVEACHWNPTTSAQSLAWSAAAILDVESLEEEALLEKGWVARPQQNCLTRHRTSHFHPCRTEHSRQPGCSAVLGVSALLAVLPWTSGACLSLDVLEGLAVEAALLPRN